MTPAIRKKYILFLLFMAFVGLLPLCALAAETPTMVIEEAKFAIEQARKAGADRVALEDVTAAKSWLSQAEKEYEAQMRNYLKIVQGVYPGRKLEGAIVYVDLKEVKRIH